MPLQPPQQMKIELPPSSGHLSPPSAGHTAPSSPSRQNGERKPRRSDRPKRHSAEGIAMDSPQRMGPPRIAGLHENGSNGHADRLASPPRSPAMSRAEAGGRSVPDSPAPTMRRGATYGSGHGHSAAAKGHGAGGEAGKGHGSAHKMGTFHGVLMPTCENMWGVIIFLRFYVIVGNAGLGLSVLIVTLSFLVALLTSLSLSAIATCGTSHSLQGVYPMLARALGREIATAIGFVYFLGVVFLAVLECLGACEELFMVNRSLGEFPLAVQMWGSIFMLSLTAMVAGGVKMISHAGVVFFLIVLLTLLAFYVGLFGAPHLHAFDAEPHHGKHFHLGLSAEHLANNFAPDYLPGHSFSSSLALFFPCFTGILSGANRASSLADPSTAIPHGTIGAITISYVMYMSYMFLWAAVGEREFLQLDHGQLDLLLWPSVKVAQIGIVLSSLGQALQCLVVAPRLLASIAQDRTLRPLIPLAVRTAGEPKRALLFAYVVGGLCVLIGSLDLVAPLLSMCFLLCYSFMNLNCFVLDVLKDPHWRPKWKYFHWSVGLAGFVLCTALMFTINFVYALIAWLLAAAILIYILRNNAERDWGSALHGLRFQVAVRSLAAIDMASHLDRSWKPQLLLLYQLREEEDSDDPERRALNPGHTHKLMFSIANQLRHGSGLIIACAIIPLLPDENEDDIETVEWADEERRQMEYMMKDMRVDGFSMTVLTRDAKEGKRYAIQNAGLGPLMPNTVVMGWPWWWKQDPKEHVPIFVSAIHQATLANKAVLLGHNLKDFPTDEDPAVVGYIDVWWIKHDGGLLLLLSHLLQKHRVWKKCLLRLHLITESGTDPQLIKERMHRLLAMINISATVEEVILVDSSSVLPYMATSETRVRKQETKSNLNNSEIVSVEQLIENPLPLEDEDKTLREALSKRRTSVVSARPATNRASAGEADSTEGVTRAPSKPTPGADKVVVVDKRDASQHGRERSASGNKLSLTRTSATSLSLSGVQLEEPALRRQLSVPSEPQFALEPLPTTRQVSAPVHRPSCAPRVPPPRIEVSPETRAPSFGAAEPLSAAGGSHLASRAPTIEEGASVSHGIEPVAEPAPPPPPPPAGASAQPRPRRLPPNLPHPKPISPPPSPPPADVPPERSSVRPPPADDPPERNNNLRPVLIPRTGSGVDSRVDSRPPPSPSANGGALGSKGTHIPRTASGNIPRTASGTFMRMPMGMPNLWGGGAEASHSPTATAAPTGVAADEQLELPPALLADGTPRRPSDAASSIGISASLQRFIEKYELDDEKASELNQIFEKSIEEAMVGATSYMWDEIHEIIQSHSENSVLVIVNLPDPPDVTRVDGAYTDEGYRKMVEYMDYMEGLAANLPRVLFVHGSGQEVISFDAA